MTVFLAIIAFILLPRDVASSRYFTDLEKSCATMRLEKEQEVERVAFSLSATLKPLYDWHTWMFAFMALCYGVAAASVSNFLPVSSQHTLTGTLAEYPDNYQAYYKGDSQGESIHNRP
jgi:hypothetical protein